MKKLMFLFVLAIGVMSVNSIESLNSNDDVTQDFEISVNYEISVDEEGPIMVYTCTVTRLNPDYTTTSVTRTSFISARAACSYAYDALVN